MNEEFREKVIKAMECCAVGAECDHCPYSPMNKSGHEGCYQMHADVLAILIDQQETIWALEIDLDDTLDVMCEYAEELKAQEPRTMTLEEAQGEDEVWFEFRPSNVGRYADCYMHDTGDRTRVYFTGKSVMSLFENADYGRQWRCWTAKPTEEQRKAVKWDEDQR